ncbi:MAG: hypothetical protein AB7F75_03670 [Planctomycetota bacterium]
MLLVSCGQGPDSQPDPETKPITEATPKAEEESPPVDPVASTPTPEEVRKAEELKRPPTDVTTEVVEPEAPKPKLVILPPEPVPTEKPTLPQEPADPQPAAPAKDTPLNPTPADLAADRSGRRFPDALRDLLESVRDNDMEESARRLRKLPARGLVPQDALLADLMTSYVHWRLGDDDKSEEILSRVHEMLKGSRGMKIAKAFLVEPRTMAYGVYTPHETRRYTLKDTLWLYIEPDNLRQEETPDGYRLSLAVDFTLRDSRGNSVHDMERVRSREFEQICNDSLKNKISKNRRRDIWYYFKIALPANINPGDYTLEIRMADLVADASKWTKSQVVFTVE